MNAEEHPVIKALRRTNRVSPRNIDWAIEHGRPYVGRRLPSGVRTFPLGACMSAADHLEGRGLGRYVYGWAMMAGSKLPGLHAWNSPDGYHAVDATWDARLTDYWGFPRRFQARIGAMTTLRGSTSSGIPLELMPGHLRSLLM